MLTRNPAPARRRALLTAPVVVLAVLVALGAGGPAGANVQTRKGQQPTIVLVHGDWADASSWTAVLERLQARGFDVVAPPNTLRGPGVDATYLASYLQSISGPIVLVAHSYGGFVATNAATGVENVKALVYVDAFAPDEGETLGALATTWGSCVRPNGLNAVPFDGGVDVYLRWEANPPYPGYRECFANGVDPEKAAVLAAEQRPAALVQYEQPSGPPAWKTIPSWSLIGTQDNVIPPALQEYMASRAGRPRHAGQGRPPVAHHAARRGDEGDPRRGRGDNLIAQAEVAASRGDLAPSRLVGRRGGGRGIVPPWGSSRRAASGFARPS